MLTRYSVVFVRDNIVFGVSEEKGMFKLIKNMIEDPGRQQIRQEAAVSDAVSHTLRPPTLKLAYDG